MNFQKLFLNFISNIAIETRVLLNNVFSPLAPKFRRKYTNLIAFIKHDSFKTFFRNTSGVLNNSSPYHKPSRERLHESSTLLNTTNYNTSWTSSSLYFIISKTLAAFKLFLLDLSRRSFGPGFLCLRGLFTIAFVDALITDDEPIWEPLEWSLMQTWLMFIFLFAWIAENLITSRFGSYTGRDKRVWFSWFKTFWLVEGWYTISLCLAALFVITPFYHELTYPMPFIVSWWNWYSRVFFFKFTHTFTLLLLIAYFLQISIRWHNWKKSFILILFINFGLAYLLYCHFFFTLFGYLTDPSWFAKYRSVDYIQLSHEPNKWAWGPSSRDHFTYHRSTTVFWFKTDGQFSGAFLFFHINFFLLLFFLNFYWLTLIRRVYTTREITHTFTTYCVSSLRQFFYFFLALHGLIFFSYILNYWSFPIEFLWLLNPSSWFSNFFSILNDYPSFLYLIFTK